MWAGLSLATLFGKLVFDLLPFTKVSTDINGNNSESEETDDTAERKDLAMVA